MGEEGDDGDTPKPDVDVMVGIEADQGDCDNDHLFLCVILIKYRAKEEWLTICSQCA